MPGFGHYANGGRTAGSPASRSGSRLPGAKSFEANHDRHGPVPENSTTLFAIAVASGSWPNQDMKRGGINLRF
jgi:hypothetical protein